MNVSPNRTLFSVAARPVVLFTIPVLGVSVADVRPRIPLDEPAWAIDVRISTLGGKDVHLALQPQGSRVGTRRWLWTCPACSKLVRCLYANAGAMTFICRRCAGLVYASKTWKSAARLMHHFAERREALGQRRCGGRPSRGYWVAAAKEQAAIRKFLYQVERHT